MEKGKPAKTQNPAQVNPARSASSSLSLSPGRPSSTPRSSPRGPSPRSARSRLRRPPAPRAAPAASRARKPDAQPANALARVPVSAADQPGPPSRFVSPAQPPARYLRRSPRRPSKPGRARLGWPPPYKCPLRPPWTPSSPPQPPENPSSARLALLCCAEHPAPPYTRRSTAPPPPQLTQELRRGTRNSAEPSFHDFGPARVGISEEELRRPAPAPPRSR